MRLHIHLSKNTSIVPFVYQERQVSKLHYWIGRNEVHDKVSLYSFSWLKNGRQEQGGLNFRNGSQFFLSCYDNTLIKQIIKKIQEDNDFGWGMKITSLTLENDPDFESPHRFLVASPVFIKRYQPDGKGNSFFYHNDQEANQYLTESLQHKLKEAGFPYDEVVVRFDDSYPNATTKGASYKGIFNKGSVCPVIIKGTPEQIAFAWNVGVGNLTGIGFGSLI
ncbi:MAG: CRISPR-associated endoribonuclease Cas6 [Spirosomataceae bacterium]